jgi:hypothetical protein
MSADALIARFEKEKSRALGNAGRREAGLYYTPGEIADQVLAAALLHGGVRVTARALDPCAGAGAFLVGGGRARRSENHPRHQHPQ